MSTTDVLCPYAHRYDLRRHRPLTRIDIDEDALERVMTLAGSGPRTRRSTSPNPTDAAIVDEAVALMLTRYRTGS